MLWVVLLVLFLHRPQPTLGGPYALEPTQILNHIELVIQIENQISQILNQLKMIEDMYLNTMSVPFHVWGRIQESLRGLHEIVRTGQAIAYSLGNIDEEMRGRFEGYEIYPEYHVQYQDWMATSLDSIRGAMNAANLQMQQFEGENAFMRQMQTLSVTSVGRRQALQTGLQIANMQVQQIQKLRQLFMAQMQAQNMYYSAQQQDEASRRAITEAVQAYREVTPNKYKAIEKQLLDGPKPGQSTYTPKSDYKPHTLW
jgi:P-type conjugative transfer protein TrbJ